MRAPDGRPVNALRGMLDFIARLTTQYAPTHLACAWDNDWRPQWRVDLVPSYKAHRVVDEVNTEEVPDELYEQVPLIRRSLELLEIPVIGFDGFEADDVLGSLSRQFDGEVLVVTGDRDLFQLADDRTKVLYVAKGVAKHEIVDSDWVSAKYGVSAAAYVDFAVLRGDPSDGLPGVTGIGEKTAASLLAKHRDLAGIVTAVQDPGSAIAPRARAAIAGAIEYLAAAQQVVSVATDLPIPPLQAIADAEIDRDTFEIFATEFGLGGAAERVLAALGGGQ